MNLKKFIPKDVIVITILAIVLVFIRDIIFNSSSFNWLPWNIFLAFIPFVISSYLVWLDEKNKLKNINIVIGGVFWLLFIPNTIYIVTDLIHIGVVRSVPALYDSFLVFSSAWVGLSLGLYSLSHIDQIIRKRFSKLTTEVIIFVITIFISLGVYLGRFLRFNSWDIFGNPTTLLKSAYQTFLKPQNPSFELMYLVLFTVFTYLFYRAFKFTKENKNVI